MDLEKVKYHAQELHNILIQEPNNHLFAKLCIEIETLLNSNPLKRIEISSEKERNR